MEKHITPLSGPGTTAVASISPKEKQTVPFRDMLKSRIDVVKQQSNQGPAPAQVILVGEISHEHKTVSELLHQHKDLRSSSWDILSSEPNQKKDYTKLLPGTRIYYAPAKGELTWSTVPPAEASGRQATANGQVHSSLQPDSSYKAWERLGVISRDAPTVSHLLKAHPLLQDTTWSILSSAVNQPKNFTSLPVGAEVLFNPATSEVTWQQPGHLLPGSVNPVEDVTPAPAGKATADTPVVPGASATGTAQPVLLGRIDHANTTVSHLLTNHPLYRDRTWELLASSSNQGKPFDRIPAGTAIYLDPETLDISWNSRQPPRQEATASLPAMQQPGNTPMESDYPIGNLTEAVQPLLGTSYREIDCYELLVEGLRRMDIPYEGKDGLFTKLTAMARDKGMPVNAYLNGEGIVKAAGSLVYSKTYAAMADWKQEADRLYGEMEPLLDMGQILSFSTENRGHTGIVSQQDNQWTFINSGRLDNPVAVNSVRRGVGEEVLRKEIRNWFRLAHANSETLKVTLGQLEQDRIRTAQNLGRAISNRI